MKTRMLASSSMNLDRKLRAASLGGTRELTHRVPAIAENHAAGQRAAFACAAKMLAPLRIQARIRSQARAEIGWVGIADHADEASIEPILAVTPIESPAITQAALPALRESAPTELTCQCSLARRHTHPPCAERIVRTSISCSLFFIRPSTLGRRASSIAHADPFEGGGIRSNVALMGRKKSLLGRRKFSVIPRRELASQAIEMADLRGHPITRK